MDPNCPFCKIVAKQMESKEVYSDDTVMSVLDINPASRGHILVFPKNHYQIMPMIPPDEFKHLAKVTFELSKSLRSSMVSTNNTIFIANGGVAGQQSAHFLLHIVPSDQLTNFDVESKALKDMQTYAALKQRLGQAMANHASREGRRYQIINSEHLFETDLFVAKIPENLAANGAITVLAKKPLDQDTVEDFFYLASHSASQIFEQLGAHGTNLIITESDLNTVKAEIIPRFSGDGLNFLWAPRQFSDNEMRGIQTAASMGAMGISIEKNEVPEIQYKHFDMDEFKKIPKQDNFISRKLQGH